MIKIYVKNATKEYEENTKNEMINWIKEQKYLNYEIHDRNELTKEIIIDVLKTSENDLSDFITQKPHDDRKKQIEEIEDMPLSEAIDYILDNKELLRPVLAMRKEVYHGMEYTKLTCGKKNADIFEKRKK